MHFHPLRPDQPHHPDLARSGCQQLGDLVLQFALVLARAGILHRQRRRLGQPGIVVTGRRRSDGHIRRSQGARFGADADISARPLNVGVAVQHQSAGDAARTVLPTGGGAVNGMAVGQFIAVAIAQLVGAKRTAAETLGLIGHGNLLIGAWNAIPRLESLLQNFHRVFSISINPGYP